MSRIGKNELSPQHNRQENKRTFLSMLKPTLFAANSRQGHQLYNPASQSIYSISAPYREYRSLCGKLNYNFFQCEKITFAFPVYFGVVLKHQQLSKCYFYFIFINFGRMRMLAITMQKVACYEKHCISRMNQRS